MQRIRAIIVYNGGSGGDFLKGVCNQQLSGVRSYDVTPRGHVEFANHHFKYMIEAMYRGETPQMDTSLMHPVENTHYYVNGIESLSNSLFYIDYPDHLHDFVIDRVCNTRFGRDTSKLLAIATQYLPESIQKRLTITDAKTVLRVAYRRNLKLWSENSKLQAVSLSDIVNPLALPEIVKTICGTTTIDEDILLDAQREWLYRNPQLLDHAAYS